MGQSILGESGAGVHDVEVEDDVMDGDVDDDMAQHDVEAEHDVEALSEDEEVARPEERRIGRRGGAAGARRSKCSGFVRLA